MSFPVWERIKDPDEVVDYMIDWAGPGSATQAPGPLFGTTDTITSSTWIVPTGITRQSDSQTPTTATIWLQGGTAGQKYSFVNRIVTAGGRTFDQTAILKVKDR